MVGIGDDAAPAKMLAKRTVTQEDDVVATRVFLSRWPTATGTTMVVLYAHEWALVESVIGDRVFFDNAGQGYHHTIE